jgi:hypothetical protein
MSVEELTPPTAILKLESTSIALNSELSRRPPCVMGNLNEVKHV